MLDDDKAQAKTNTHVTLQIHIETKGLQHPFSTLAANKLELFLILGFQNKRKGLPLLSKSSI